MNIQTDDSRNKRSALASTTADLRELTGNSRATVQELQAFLRELKGKSPHEMLGVVASSYLARALVISTVTVVGGILIFTAIPYFFGAKDAPAAIAATPPPVVSPPVPQEAPKLAPPPDLSPLGVGEQKTAPPDKNPLENKSDDFLKDLE